VTASAIQLAFALALAVTLIAWMAAVGRRKDK
jgi:hypothetical protein